MHLPVSPVKPPAKTATSLTEVAAKTKRPTLSTAVDHACVAALYKSTVTEPTLLEPQPPANMAMFPTDAAATPERATLS
jgi:hypothetical protein